MCFEPFTHGFTIIDLTLFYQSDNILGKSLFIRSILREKTPIVETPSSTFRFNTKKLISLY